jgi:hypothetical protein
LSFLTGKRFRRQILAITCDHVQNSLIHSHFLAGAERKVTFRKHLACDCHSGQQMQVGDDSAQQIITEVFVGHFPLLYLRGFSLASSASLSFISLWFSSLLTERRPLVACSVSQRADGPTSEYRPPVNLVGAASRSPAPTLPEVAGLAGHYVAKLLAVNPVKRVGMISLGPLLAISRRAIADD